MATNAATITGLIAAASVPSGVLAFHGLPDTVVETIEGPTDSQFAFLLLAMAMLMRLGRLLQSMSVPVVVAPLLMPGVKTLGIDRIHVGAVCTVAMVIGLVTPPVGWGAYIAMVQASIRMGSLFEAAVPFLRMVMPTTVLIAAVPLLSTCLQAANPQDRTAAADPMTTSEPDAAIQHPIEDFSHCHVGILKKPDMLDMLGERPVQLVPAARAREVAELAVGFFGEAVFEHHLDEERALFPAELAGAVKGDEHDKVQATDRQLTDEHRDLQATWKRLVPSPRQSAMGQALDVGGADIERRVSRCRAHAAFEEQAFLCPCRRPSRGAVRITSRPWAGRRTCGTRTGP